MSRKEIVLVTGANGEVGHGLIKHLGENQLANIVAIDIHPLDEELRPYCREMITGDILDKMLLGRLVFAYEIRTIYHLASILSTRAEFNPEAAHRVNVEGTLNLLRLGVEQSQWQGRAVKFIYPSSIAVYGLPDLATKEREGRLSEWQWTAPRTMYGCNKLYCEHLGRYYASYYRQLARDRHPASIDFRCVRFPGLISAFTLPAGGTSDYAPEMIHQAAQNLPYACFVRPDTRIPFMVMPDAVRALVDLEAAPRAQLSTEVYNVTSFSLSAAEIRAEVRNEFPQAQVSFEPDLARQGIIDSWPADVDDDLARKDWDWRPQYGHQQAFYNYLFPNIRQRYA
ncbi:MAG: NAD-dependent epimerase/dehydratase family protein [Chloroflexi bacterium]|nr:NAD-dependent epimerase/dehydratase family protein [Chloroflexota bacterium]